VFLVTAALILPAEFPHSVSDPGQCTRARVHGEGPVPADREGMADINAWYSRLLAADEARDAAALAAVAWQMYGQLATTAADLGTLRARFRVYATAPRASGRRRPAPRGAQVGDRAATA
jgi:hypothetical protein